MGKSDQDPYCSPAKSKSFVVGAIILTRHFVFISMIVKGLPASDDLCVVRPDQAPIL